MITICDSNQVIALGGVMGASCSQIDEHTTHIVLESAHFDADTIRATSKKLGLRTDASARFEKGIDRYRCEKALNRFCQLVEELEIGTVCKGFVDTATELDDKSTANIPICPPRQGPHVGVDKTAPASTNISAHPFLIHSK